MPDPLAPDIGGTPQGVQNILDLGAGGSQPLADSAQVGERQQTANTPPKQSAVPALAGFLQQMVSGPKGQIMPGEQPMRPASRLDAFENFLGNFLNSFSSGMSNAGTGPAANARGFGAAVQAPYQRQVGQFQLQQQQQQAQSENQLRAAQAESVRSQAQLVDTPWGKMPAKLAAGMMGQYVKGGAAAQTAADSRESVAQTKGQFDLKKASITAGGKARTELQLIGDSLKGNKDAQAQLDVLQKRRLQLVDERNKGMNQRPLYQLQKAIDPDTGQVTFVTGMEIEEAKKLGKNYIPSGPLSQKEIISVQQLQSEAAPAIKAVRDNISAFDNADDRAIFARLLQGAGSPARGDEAGWMGTILNQALQSNLSDKGRLEAQSLNRLAETMGRLRSTLGLPATDQSMAVTLSLLPGRSTGGAKYASGQVDQIEQMIKQAVSIPALAGASGGGSPKANPKSDKVGSLVDRYKGKTP